MTDNIYVSPQTDLGLYKVCTMIKNILFSVFLCFGSFVAIGCSQSIPDSATTTTKTKAKTEVVSVTIVGSAEFPDPVLERVMELERQRIVKDVLVMESFPVQIRLSGPVEVIKELESIPRKK